MTNSEFKSEIRNLYKESNRFNRFWAILLIIGGLAFMFYILFTGINIKTNDQLVKLASTIGIITLPLIPISGGLLVIYRIPRLYNPTQILSTASRDNKVKLIESSLAEYKILGKGTYNGILIYDCRNRYLSYFRIYFYVDNSQFLFNVQSEDLGQYYYRGVFDLGLARRITRKIKASL